jgi:hypothetical protein
LRLLPKCRLKDSKDHDLAASADPAVNRIPVRAKQVVIGQQVKAGVEVEGRAVGRELGADARAVGKDEIDIAAAREHGPADRARRNALGSFPLNPGNALLLRWTRSDWNPPDHLVPDDKPSDALADPARVGRGHPQRQGQERQKDCGVHCLAIVAAPALCNERFNE